MKKTESMNWWTYGVESGEIGDYPRELIRFMESEFEALLETEKLVVLFTWRFLEAGHVQLPLDRSPKEWGLFLDLDDTWIKLLDDKKITSADLGGSSVIGHEPTNPFQLQNDRVSFTRYANLEQNLAEWIIQKSHKTNDLQDFERAENLINKYFNPDDSDRTDWQKVAVALSLIKKFVIISGGPGTGKTTTVARLLATHQGLADRPLTIGLAAPTGKAAGRMGEALYFELAKLGLNDEELSAFPKEAKTVHRLLSGIDTGGLLPPVEKNELRYDLLIVDEASMIDLTLMSRLCQNLSSDATLVLLGDKDQLASVEAGFVFSDLCDKAENRFSPVVLASLKNIGIEQEFPEGDVSSLNDSIVYLTHSYRFDEASGIGRLSQAVLSGEDQLYFYENLYLEFDDIEHKPFSYNRAGFETLLSGMKKKIGMTEKISTADALLRFWKSSVWLSPIRRGPAGTERLNSQVEAYISRDRSVEIEGGWYHGRPIIITRNDYGLGVFNGDQGVCVREEGRLWVYVESGSKLRRISPSRLAHYEPAYFLTVHKSQGSEFDHVNLLMPKEYNDMLSRELLYTAITRARKLFTLNGSLNFFARGAGRHSERFTGLRDRLNE